MPGRPRPLAVVSGVQARGVVLILCLLSSVTAAAQTSEPAQAPQQAGDSAQAPQPARPDAPGAGLDVDRLPLSLDRISQRLEKTSTLDLSAMRPTFRVQIFGTRPRWSSGIDWLGTANGMRPPAGTPWHDQFLNMVTPPQARSFGAFQGMDLLQVMGTSLAQGLAAQAVVGKIKSTLRDRRERAAREEVDAAIAAWKEEQDAAAARKAAVRQPSTVDR